MLVGHSLWQAFSAAVAALCSTALPQPVMNFAPWPVAAGRAALVHQRFALSRFAATKALLRREVTLMQRNAIVYAYRLCQVSAGGMQQLRVWCTLKHRVSSFYSSLVCQVVVAVICFQDPFPAARRSCGLNACRLPLLFLHTQLYFSGQASTLTASTMARNTWQPSSLPHTFSMLLHGELSAIGLLQYLFSCLLCVLASD